MFNGNNKYSNILKDLGTNDSFPHENDNDYDHDSKSQISNNILNKTERSDSFVIV